MIGVFKLVCMLTVPQCVQFVKDNLREVGFAEPIPSCNVSRLRGH
jgi:hypothetical protein